jgi:hypothetical protein
MRPARQSGSLSGMPQISRRRLAMTHRHGCSPWGETLPCVIGANITAHVEAGFIRPGMGKTPYSMRALAGLCWVMKRFFQNGESANVGLMPPPMDLNQAGNIPGLVTNGCPSDTAAWKKVVVKYQQPSRWRGVWQIETSAKLF